MAKGNPIYVPYGYKEQPMLNPNEPKECHCDIEAQKRLDEEQNKEIDEIKGSSSSKLDTLVFAEYSGNVQTILDELSDSASGLTEDLNELVDKLQKVSGNTVVNAEDILALSGADATILDKIGDIVQTLSGKADSDFVVDEINKVKNDVVTNAENIDKLNSALSGFSGNIADALSGLTSVLSGKTNTTDFEQLSGDVASLSALTLSISGDIPTKVSQLENDVPYLTEHQDLSGYVKDDELADIIIEHTKKWGDSIRALGEGLAKVNTDVAIIEGDLVDIVDNIQDIEANKASVSDLNELSGKMSTYDEKLVDFANKVALMANQQEVDTLASKVNGLSGQLSQKADSLDLLSLQNKVDKHLKESDDLGQRVEALEIGVDELDTKLSVDKEELLGKINEESEKRDIDDKALAQTIEDTKQELIGEIQNASTTTLNQAKDFTTQAKNDLSGAVDDVKDELSDELSNKADISSIYLRADVDDKLNELHQTISGEVDTKVTELKALIKERDKTYEETYGGLIHENRSLIDELREEYDETKEEVHVINDVLFGSEGQKDTERIKRLIKKMEELDNLDIDKVVTDDKMSGYTYSKDEVDTKVSKVESKIFFERQEDGGTIVKSKTGNKVIEITGDGILYVMVEGELMSINELIAQLAHETY